MYVCAHACACVNMCVYVYEREGACACEYTKSSLNITYTERYGILQNFSLHKIRIHVSFPFLKLILPVSTYIESLLNFHFIPVMTICR